MERTAWTDERLDERMTAVDQRFDRLDRKIDDLRDEMRAGFAEMRAEMAALRADFNSLRNVLIQVAFGLAGVLTAGIVALVIAQA